MPNFIKLDQTMYEKSVTKILDTFQYFGAAGEPSTPKFTNLGGDVEQGPLYQTAKFRPLLKTPRYLLPNFVDFVDGVTPRTRRQS